MTFLLEQWLRRRIGWALVLPLAAGPDSAFAQSGRSALPLESTGAMIAIAFAVLAAAVLLGFVVGRAATRRARIRAICRRLDRFELPAALTRYNGVFLHANPAMRAILGETRGRIDRALARTFAVDAALVYRLALEARESGFGLEQVRTLSDRREEVLSARFVDPDFLVWTLLPSDRARGLLHGKESEVAESVPFAHLRIHGDGTTTANPAYQERYGEPVDLPAALFSEEALPAGGAILLQRRGGGAELCRVWGFSTGAAEPAGRDVFIFPVDREDDAPSAPAALEAIPVALMQLDQQGRLLWFNAQARELIGTALRPDTPLAELVEPLGRPVDALIADTATGSTSRREMFRLRGAELETFVDVSLTPVELEGVPSLLAVLSDANELRQLEDRFAQSQKMEAVGKLAGGVAHDFNNVLTAISGHSDLLLLGKDALHPDHSDLTQIRQNAHRAAALVRQLLAFSRKQTLKPELLSVQDIVSDTQYLLGRLIGEKVALTVDHGPDLGMVRADHQQLEQALLNLVVNARDAMPEGGSVTIATRNVTIDERTLEQNVEVPAGSYVEIDVSDTGSGIPPHVLDRLFEPFFTTKARGEGTGLGLSTVYGIVKQSGGFIFAENRPEGGACFRLLLPRAVPGAEEAAPRAERDSGDRRDLTGKGAVLLVEDEDPVRSFASRALRLRGYEVIEAASAEEAMDLLSDPERRVDVLVSDVVMPGMDGPSFAIEARRMRPGLRVVFVSGYAEDSFRRHAFDDEFLFLPKPFSLADLTAKVKEALSESS